MDSVLFTSENNRLQLHNRDGVSSVRVDRLMSETDKPFDNYPGLALAVSDEANLALWSEELSPYINPNNRCETIIGKTFAVWESLMMGVGPVGAITQPFPLDFCIRLYYTVNPPDTEPA